MERCRADLERAAKGTDSVGEVDEIRGAIAAVVPRGDDEPLVSAAQVDRNVGCSSPSRLVDGFGGR